MPSASRRAFLRGRRAPTSPWEQFCQRLRAAVTGSLHVHDAYDGSTAHQAWLTPRQAADVHHARRLCAEYGVALALDHSTGPDWPLECAVLWVKPDAALGVCERLQLGGAMWFVQPGCTSEQLDALGLPGFGDLPAHVSIAAWLSDDSLCRWETGQTARSGISHLSVLLADGSSVVLGPFGAQQETPLTTTTQRQLVSGLFSLLTTEAAQHCLAAAQWPARYRLDALRPCAGADINLAHLLAGHGGDLGWVEWLVFDERLLGQQACTDRVMGCRDQDAVLRQHAQILDAQVKALFDPQGLFGIGRRRYTMQSV